MPGESDSKTVDILVVEDEPLVQDMIQLILTRQGWGCRCAYSIREGTEQLQQKRPDLLVLDWSLPDGEGVEFCKIVKADLRFSGIPVLLMTGAYKDAQSAVFGMDLGADEFIRKPFDYAEFLLRIRLLLRKVLR